MQMQYSLIRQEDGSENLTVFMNGSKPLACHSTHPNFEAILTGVRQDDENVIDLFDVAQTAGMKFQRLTERVTAANGRLYLDGEEVHDALADQVVRFLKEGVEDWKPLASFFENLQNNPNEHSRKELYSFLQTNSMTLTEDGMIVGYKALLKTDTEGLFKSNTEGTATVDGQVYEGQIPQQVGSLVEMPRSEVVYEPNYACHVGLHVGNYRYASTYLRGDNAVLLEVHVNPRDVVSVPYNGDKMRVCRYKIVKAVEQEHKAPVVPAAPETKPKESVAQKLKKAAQKVGKREVKDVRVGDVYEDTDKRRTGRRLKVKAVNTDSFSATVEGAQGKVTYVALDRLQSRKYKLVKRGRKK